MKLKRRDLLKGSAAIAAYSSLSKDARAWLHPGKQQIAQGWNTLPLGGGGDIWGLDIANDGSMVCRGDVLGAYVWSGTSALASLTDGAQKWRQVCTYSAFGFNAGNFSLAAPWEYVQAPGNSNYQYMVTGDIGGTLFYFLYYSTDKGNTFTKTSISMNALVSGLGPKNGETNKVGVDPNNEKIVYCGMPVSSGMAAAIYTTFDRTLGQTWPTFNAATLNGVTAFPLPTFGGGGAVSGIVFDTNVSSGGGTITIGGNTVTKRILICIGGVDYYESTDGGQNWSATGLATLLGTSSFHVHTARLDANGNLFCSIMETGQCCRYMSGVWKDISPATHGGDYIIFIDPRPGNYPTGGIGYLTISGGNGITTGWTTTNSTATTPTWGGSTAGRNVTLSAASYDAPWMNYLFGQGPSVGYTDGNCAVMDANGAVFWGGNQSIWYFSAIPNWGVSTTSTSYSFGRGQEGVVACDIICPPGANYPVMACQDIGAPLIGNTFVKYPTDLFHRGSESTCQNLDYSPDDPSFIVARQTGQPSQNDYYGDYSGYSNDFGASWTPINYPASAAWQCIVNGSITGSILTVNSFVSASASCSAGSISGATFTPGGTTVGTFLVGMFLHWPGGGGTLITLDNGNGTFNVANVETVGPAAFTGSAPSTNVFPGAFPVALTSQIKPYGSDGTTGTGGAGGSTYSLTASPGNVSGNISLATVVTAGQAMPVDRDHLIAVPDFPNAQYIPAYTANARAATLGGTTSWSLCSGLPVSNYMVRGGWSFGATSKPIAAGYGADLGTVWIAHYDKSTGVITLYRSTDFGATFASTGAGATGQTSASGIYLLAVPGYPNELWLGLLITSGSACLWHITSANSGSALFNTVTMPATYTLLKTLTLGVNSGGYPFLYGTFQQSGIGQSPEFLHKGTWNGSSLSWALYGPAGATQGSSEQLPSSMQVNGAGFLRGDWNVPGRLYAGNNGLGFAYYNP